MVVHACRFLSDFYGVSVSFIRSVANIVTTATIYSRKINVSYNGHIDFFQQQKKKTFYFLGLFMSIKLINYNIGNCCCILLVYTEKLY